MINLVIDILKANSTLTNLVDANNIYPLIQLQGGTIPSVVVQLTNTDPNDTQDKVSTYDNNSIEITSMAISPAAAWAISEAVRASIDGYSGGLLAQIRFQSQATDVFESTEVFSVTQSYSVHLKRDGATLPIAIAGLGEFNLDDISDVDASSPADDQVLTYDAATDTWGPEDASTVAALDDLTDVTITTPANNQALVYNEAAGEWRNDALSLTQLEGIDSELGDAIDRQALVFDEASNQWIADGVGQVVIPVRNSYRDDTLTVGQVVKAVGAQGDRIKVELFDPAVDDRKTLVGVISEEIAGGQDGHAQVYGELRNINTDDFEVGDILYPQSDGSFDTTENEYPIGIVTRSHQNTGRLFIRLWAPGKGYHQRYRTEALSEMFIGVGATVELYYTATADGDGYVTQDLTAAVGDGNVEERVLYYKAGAFGDSGTTSGYTNAGLDTDATYAEMLTAFNNLLKTEGAPITIYATRTEVAGRTGLLNEYGGAAAAYSLRLLDTDYTGSAIRVRRASDNTEQDIGFDENGDLDTTSLATFCSGTNGFVKTWYDQSGNGHDITQTKTANQPKIYDSSTGVITRNGKPAIYFSTSYQLGDNSWVGGNVNVCDIINVHQMVSSTNGQILFWYDLTFQRMGIQSGNTVLDWGSGTVGEAVDTDQHLIYARANNGSGQIWTDSIAGSVGTTTANRYFSDRFWINGNGFYGINSMVEMYQQEFVFYTSNQSESNRTGIESNINTYYSIYS